MLKIRAKFYLDLKVCRFLQWFSQNFYLFLSIMLTLCTKLHPDCWTNVGNIGRRSFMELILILNCILWFVFYCILLREFVGRYIELVIYVEIIKEDCSIVQYDFCTHEGCSISKFPQCIKMKWELITASGVPHLFPWSIIIFQLDLQAHWCSLAYI
jgi:hypothetical protein